MKEVATKHIFNIKTQIDIQYTYIIVCYSTIDND